MGKKHKIIEDEGFETTSPHLMSFPSLSSGHSLVDLHCRMSSTELMRASDSIFKQVDWSKVVLDVLGEERPAIFRDAFTEILQAQIEELLEQEGNQETWNMQEPDIVNGDNSSDTGAVNEEDENGSQGYSDDADEDEEEDEDEEVGVGVEMST